MKKVDRDRITDLIEDHWRVVGYSNEHHVMLEDDDVERVSHKVLLQKGSALLAFDIQFDGHEYTETYEIMLAPGRSN